MAAYASPAPYGASSPENIPAQRSSWSDPRGGRPDPGSGRAFANIKDLIRDSKPHFAEDTSLPQYLAEAENCVSLIARSLDFGRPDIAFKNYLKAYEIAATCIPLHPDCGFWSGRDKNWALKYKTLRQKLVEMESQMKSVRQVVEENNARYGTQPQSPERTLAHSPPSGFTAKEVKPWESGLESIQNATENTASISSGLPLPIQITQSRPLSDFRLKNSQGDPVSEVNELQLRFARLRGSENVPTQKAAPTVPQRKVFPEKVADKSYTEPNTSSQPALANGVSVRPEGPRDMPSHPNRPSIPPKVPLPTSAVMPKPPSPTYSPTNVAMAGLQGPASRLSSEGGRPPSEKRQTYYVQSQNGSTTSLQLQRTRDEILLPYRPTTPNGVNTAIIPKSSSSEIPHNTVIDSLTLKNYMSKFNVLLVDVRERGSFDEGHIMASSVICIEPVSLKEGVSAEELEERLVLAPDSEQILFSRRNEFDIVVYYDQDTADIAYLQGPPTMTKAPALRAFYDTLYEFNDTKPLKDGRPPALLQGGIEAWVGYMSVHSLAQSKTAAMLGTTRQRLAAGRGRPIARQRMVSSNSRFDVRNRRLRGHKFLDESEQQAWRQQAQQEEVKPTELTETDSDGEYVMVEEEAEPTSPFVNDVDTFLRRFPSVRDQQSMTMPARRPVGAAPRYESAPVPAIPTRPTPAIPRPSYSGQADIRQPQAPLARVTSATRPPLYSSTSLTRHRKLPQSGLTNFGVTCYMNSTLQCLSATIPLSQFFTDRGYEHFIQKNWKGSNGIMPKFYANVVQALWKDDMAAIKPSSLRNFCGRMNREWVIDRQQDAKEFFDFLVDCLHEDLNINWERNPLRPLTTDEEMQRERMAIAKVSSIEWQRYEHRDRSILSSLFAGQHASRLRCLSCGKTSTTYEAFYSISIEIPRSGVGHIYDCLKSYTKEEKLSELWKCPYCKREREATKQIILTRLPQFLVIHFKRFAASKTEKTKKIHTPIEFPLHALSMDDFVIQRSPSMPDQDGNIDLATSPPYTYDAYGVLRHLGNSGDGGHYISLVKDPGRGCWRKFDDERHYDLDPTKLGSRDRLQNSEAYIVFFQRAIVR